MERALLPPNISNPTTHITVAPAGVELLAEGITIDGLEEFHFYRFSVAVWTAEGSNSDGGVICHMTIADLPSSAPRDVSLVVETNTSATVAWREPLAIHHNGVIQRYVIQVENVNTSFAVQMPETNQTNQTSYLLEGMITAL